VKSPPQPADEQRYRMLFDRAPVGILFADAESYYIDANECICRMLGYSRDELIGLHASDIVVPAEVPHIQEALDEISVGSEHRREWRFRRKDGTVFPATVVATKFADGALLGMIQDVTALNELEEARRISERKLRSEIQFSDSIIESMPGIFYLYDEAGRFIRWNRNFETVSGYSADEIARMHPLDFFEGEARALVESRITEVFACGESFADTEFVDKSGTARPYFFTGRRVQFGGDPCLIGMGIDVSDLKVAVERLAENERKYRELVENANCIILRWSPDGRVTFINEFGQRLFGYSADELVGRHVTGTIVPPFESGGRNLEQLMEDICATPTTFGQNVNENMRRNGERVWVAWTNRVVRDAEGRVIELLSIGTDITDQRHSQQMLRASEERVRQAQKIEAIGLLAGGVAHDFNNMLAAILGYTYLALVDTADDHPARESLKEIKSAGTRAKSLVQQILTFARHQPQQRRVIELAPNLQEARKFLRATLPASVELEFAMDDDAPPVLADATQVYQVVANLCTNAWHALEGKPGRIEVGLRSITLDAAAAGEHLGLVPGRYACLSVTDNGRGMDAATRERIFDPFFTTKTHGGGTGLGLSVVHGIVKSHDGVLVVESQPGAGSTFRVYFPAAEARAEAALPPPVAPLRGDGQHILYLDDEEPLVALATRMLHRLGYRVSGYTRAEDALRAFRENPAGFDLVITDLNMPVKSGMEVAAELRKLRADLPVVLCSGHVTDELLRGARLAGIDEVLYKPSTMEEFSVSIHRLVSGVAARGSV
jgi:PAS domain S-box-containing protein